MITLKQFQELKSLDSGSTTYELDVCKVFNLSPNITRQELITYVGNILDYDIKQDELLKQDFKIERLKFHLNGPPFSVDQISRWNYFQALPDPLIVLNEILSVFVTCKNKKLSPEEISEQLLSLSYKDAMKLYLFFYQLLVKYLTNINISYLNKIRLELRKVDFIEEI